MVHFAKNIIDPSERLVLLDEAIKVSTIFASLLLKPCLKCFNLFSDEILVRQAYDLVV